MLRLNEAGLISYFDWLPDELKHMIIDFTRWYAAILTCVSLDWRRFFQTAGVNWNERMREWHLSQSELTLLTRQNWHKHDAHIQLQLPAHRYRLTFWDTREKRFEVFHSRHEAPSTDWLSVTTWVDDRLGKFEEDVVIANMRCSRRWSVSEYYGMTDEQIKAKWQSARERGTRLHENIERYYNKLPHDAGTPEFGLFLEWEENHRQPDGSLCFFGVNYVPHRTEQRIYDREMRLSGSVDMLYRRADQDAVAMGGPLDVMLVDWKCTNRMIQDKFTMQIQMYAAILMRNYNVNVKLAIAVRLHPDQRGYEQFYAFTNVDGFREYERLEDLFSATVDRRLEQLYDVAADG